MSATGFSPSAVGPGTVRVAPQAATRYVLRIVVLVLVVAAMVVWWWFGGHAGTGKSAASAPSQPSSAATLAQVSIAPPVVASAPDTAARIPRDAAQRALMSPNLLLQFSQVLDGLGAQGAGISRADLLSQARARLAALLPPGADIDAAMRLFERYLVYLDALDGISSPEGSGPQALAQYFAERDRIRADNFDDGERAALWAADDRRDAYNLERLMVLQDPQLSDAARQAAIAEVERSTFTPQEVQQRAEALTGERVVQQTQSFNTSGSDGAERFAQRSRDWGPEAAGRMARMDAAERSWNARIDQWQALPEGERAAAAQRLFNEQERLRLDAVLQMRNQQQGKH